MSIIFITMVLIPNVFGNVNFTALKGDLETFFVNNDADFGNYGPLYIRLAWHCTGTYRTSDGRGGCDGARIRFDPEISWDANNNLDNAILWLSPTYTKYQSQGLSWSDFIVFVGNTAIESMGGPKIPFCSGRTDDVDGKASDALDNNEIYLPASEFNATKVRDSFTIMDMNDRETIALIGGGHSFGKCHIGTSGFEGPWTLEPTKFTNQFFTNLLNIQYTLGYASPNDATTQGQYVNTTYNIMMLPTDFVLLFDPEYLKLIKEYALNETQLKIDFGNAWHKLTTRDRGAKDCIGQAVAPPSSLDYASIATEVRGILKNVNADFGDYSGFFVRLAWHCSGTYRSTDHRGGCNGARILHDPEINWPSNAGLQGALDLLAPIKSNHPNLSWGDLIIIAGTEALTSLGAPVMPFCPGRIDDSNGMGSQYLEREIYLDAAVGSAAEIRESMMIMGFNEAEITVLNGGGHSIGKCHSNRSGFEGPWTTNPTVFSNSFFTTLLDNEWEETTSPAGKRQYTDVKTRQLTMLHTDLQFKLDANFKKHVISYATDNNKFMDDFAAAWIKLVNADRFGFMCPSYNGTSTSSPTPAPPSPSSAAPLNVMMAIVTALFVMVLN